MKRSGHELWKVTLIGCDVSWVVRADMGRRALDLVLAMFNAVVPRTRFNASRIRAVGPERVIG